ncbi:MAG: hypothetical protein HYX92_00680 [Chloroflexi bacterium]|nr:hypothetical protein [Chloroflexota bacterium]
MSLNAMAVTRGDKTLVRLWLMTLFLGGMATLAVVFLADVVLAKMTQPVPPAGVEQVAMSAEMEFRHWAIYKAAKAENDAPAYAHLEKLMPMVTDPKHKSAMDGVLREHLPAGHFIHTWMTMKELLGDRPEPDLTLEEIEAKLSSAR